MNTPFEQWRSQLPGGLAPPWLEDFATRERPQDALDDLWRRRADLGRLLPIEPEVLLLDWLDRLGKEESFRSRLDEGLAAWIAENWGICKLDAADLRRRSDRWVSALTVVSVAAPTLEHAVAEALRHFGEAHEFLGPMSQSPSSDPLGVYLSIVARHQKNRELAPLWWRMCDLPPEVPYFHAVYAMAGLRGLPPEEPGSGGGFRRDVVQGLLRLGESFLRLGREGVLDPEFAEQEFLRVGRITLAAYPFPKRWRELLAVELGPDLECLSLIEQLLPGVLKQAFEAGSGDSPMAQWRVALATELTHQYWAMAGARIGALIFPGSILNQMLLSSILIKTIIPKIGRAYQGRKFNLHESPTIAAAIIPPTSPLFQIEVGLSHVPLFMDLTHDRAVAIDWAQILSGLTIDYYARKGNKKQPDQIPTPAQQ